MGGDPESRDMPQEGRDPHRRGKLFLLEILFLGFIGVAVVLAFFEALTYKLVSSRTPFVIMAPLVILIVIHGLRLWRIRDEFHPGTRLKQALSGGIANLNTVVGISAWMIGMVLMILVLGHYAGVFLFCAILMRYLARESWLTTLAVAIGTTFFIFGVFEYLFNIDLYRGLIVRYFLGFRDF